MSIEIMSFLFEMVGLSIVMLVYQRVSSIYFYMAPSFLRALPNELDAHPRWPLKKKKEQWVNPSIYHLVVRYIPKKMQIIDVKCWMFLNVYGCLQMLTALSMANKIKSPLSWVSTHHVLSFRPTHGSRQKNTQEPGVVVRQGSYTASVEFWVSRSPSAKKSSWVYEGLHFLGKWMKMGKRSGHFQPAFKVFASPNLVGFCFP